MTAILDGIPQWRNFRILYIDHRVKPDDDIVENFRRNFDGILEFLENIKKENPRTPKKKDTREF